MLNVFHWIGFEIGRGFCEALRHCPPPCPPQDRRVVRVHVAGFYTINPQGEIVMAGQALAINTAYTAPLVFTNAEGQTIPGPATGSVPALDIPGNGTTSISTDGQFVNVMLTAVGDVNLTGTTTNADGSVVTWAPDPLTGTDSVVTGVTVGTFVPGTTV